MSVAESFYSQARACTKLGSPFMGRLMRLCGDRLDRSTAIGAHIHDWAGDPHHSADSVPLRLAGGLHRLVLSGQSPELRAIYPPHDVSDMVLWLGVEAALDTYQAFLVDALGSAPQTNEIRRSVALIPALHLIASETGLPLRLSELGASAGLNLLCDQFRLIAKNIAYGPVNSPVRLTPDWTGAAPRPVEMSIRERAGVDLNPIRLDIEAERLRLMSYLWPDQSDRVANTSAAIDLALASPPKVTKADAIDWLQDRLAKQHDGEVHVIYHTIAWQYFPKKKQDRGAAMIATAGERATDRLPLVRLAMEADDIDDGAGLSIQIWPGGVQKQLARVCFHGRWIRWQA